MTVIKTTAIALTLATSFAALASAAPAQTSRAARDARAEAQQPYRGASQRATTYGNATWNSTAPNQCRIDNGYGRFDTCDH